MTQRGQYQGLPLYSPWKYTIRINVCCDTHECRAHAFLWARIPDVGESQFDCMLISMVVHVPRVSLCGAPESAPRAPSVAPLEVGLHPEACTTQQPCLLLGALQRGAYGTCTVMPVAI